MENTRNIVITQNDARRLTELLQNACAANGRGRDDLTALAGELKRARIVSPQEIPERIVTMNTRLVLSDIDTGSELTFTLVFPQDADADAGRVSVISPVGTAVLGYGENDTVEWDVPAGKRRFLIKKVVYQPEASGHYHL